MKKSNYVFILLTLILFCAACKKEDESFNRDFYVGNYLFTTRTQDLQNIDGNYWVKDTTETYAGRIFYDNTLASNQVKIHYREQKTLLVNLDKSGVFTIENYNGYQTAEGRFFSNDSLHISIIVKSSIPNSIKSVGVRE